MNLAYLILAYKNPEQLGRLVRRLDDKNVRFFIHIDKKQAIEPFKKAVEGLKRKVTFVKRERSAWGSYATVKATLNGFEAIAQDSKHHDRIVLMSGLDYPLKTNEEIREFFGVNWEKNFIDHTPMPYKNWEQGGFPRIEKYYFYVRNKIFEYPMNPQQPSLLRTCLDKAFRLVLSPKRKFPSKIKPYRGEQYFAINRMAMLAILEYVKEHPEIIKAYRHTMAPDEMFFQTVLMNCGKEHVINSLDSEVVLHLRWPKEHSAHPVHFTEKDLKELANLGAHKLFGRKFDTEVDAKILDLIDENLLQKSRKKMVA